MENSNANIPNRKGHRRKKKTPKQESPARSNGSSGPSKADHQELKAEMTSPVPSREASVDYSEVFSNGNVQDPEPISLSQEQVREAVRNPLQNNVRMDLGRRFCLLTMIHEATC